MNVAVLKKMHHNNELAAIRVIPAPLSDGWYIDVLIKQLMDLGSRTETLTMSKPVKGEYRVRRFGSIDGAAKCLKRCGVSSFSVELDESLSFVLADNKAEVAQLPMENDAGAQPAAANQTKM